MINRKERLLRAVENGFHSYAEGAAPVLDECRRGCAEDYTIYGSSKIGKNLLKYPYYNTTQTTNGITFTDNGDGTVTANGTATANAYFYIQGVATNTPLEKRNYWLSGCPEGGSELTYYLNAANKNDTGSGIAITPNGTLPYACTIIIKTGIVCENLVFRPQLELGEAATEYEPYSEEKVGDRTTAEDERGGYRIPISVNGEQTANIYLSAPLADGESVSFAADNLPELPLSGGANTVTVETEIPPQKISVSYITKVKK